MARPFKATVRQAGAVPVIDLDGEINALVEDVLNAAYDESTHDNPNAVLLNFNAVDYMDSTGIALIIGLLARARQSGVRMVACGLTDHFVEIFRITRLADFISIFADEDSAMTDLVETT